MRYYILIVISSLFLTQCYEPDNEQNFRLAFIAGLLPTLTRGAENGLCPPWEDITFLPSGTSSHSFTEAGQKLYFSLESMRNEGFTSNSKIIQFNENPGQDLVVFSIDCRGPRDSAINVANGDSGNSGANETVGLRISAVNADLDRFIGMAENKSGSGSVDFTVD